MSGDLVLLFLLLVGTLAVSISVGVLAACAAWGWLTLGVICLVLAGVAIFRGALS